MSDGSGYHVGAQLIELAQKLTTETGIQPDMAMLTRKDFDALWSTILGGGFRGAVVAAQTGVSRAVEFYGMKLTPVEFMRPEAPAVWRGR